MVDEFGKSPVNERMLQVMMDRESLNSMVNSLSLGEYYMLKTFRDMAAHGIDVPDGVSKLESLSEDIKMAMDEEGLSQEDAAKMMKISTTLNPNEFSEEQTIDLEGIIRKMKKIYFELIAKGYSDDDLGTVGEITKDE